MGSAIKPAIVCEQALEFEYSGGLFFVTDPVTGDRQAFVPHTFFISFQNAGKAMQDYWSRPEGEVLEFPKLANSA